MCGRYTLTYNIETIAQTFSAQNTLAESKNSPRYNIAPTQGIVAVMQNGARHLDLLRWGLIPSWAKDESIGNKMINARAETLAEKASFKRLLHKRRCLIVADGFYEWKSEGRGPKQPMYFSLQHHEPFAFAGLWDSWKSPDGELLRTCTIITTDANELVAPVHNRMPVILPTQAYNEWLDPTLGDEQVLLPLLKPYNAQDMLVRSVSRLVNDPKKEGPELLA